MSRSDYKIKPKIQFYKGSDLIYTLPIIAYIPWKKRYPNDCILCVAWLNFIIAFGKWERKDDV